MEVNLTAGYNLIVIPEEERFVSRAGDIVGFQTNTSGALLQRITTEQIPGVCYTPTKNTSESSVHLESMVALNVSFRLKVYGSVEAYTKLIVSCLQAVRMHPLMATFFNALPSHNNSKGLVFQSAIAVQNAISGITYDSALYITMNVTKNISVTVSHGTNVTCEWSIPNASLTQRQSPFLAEKNVTEGAACQIEVLLTRAGYAPVTITTFNLVSRHRITIHAFVREIIRGLKVEMCYSSFAYDNALTCFTSSVTSGTEVDCTWYFKHGDYIVSPISQSIVHELTPVGVRNFTLYCYNKVSVKNFVEFVVFPVQVIANPLTIEAPLKVPADTPVKITCRVNWSGGSPASFFAQEGVDAGKRGTEIIPAPNLTLTADAVRNTSEGSVTVYKSFRRRINRTHTVRCGADNYPDLNTLYKIRAIYAITGISMAYKCPSRIEVGTRCRLEVHIIRGDFASFKWTVTEGDARISVYNRRIIDHDFVNLGVTNISVNVSNDVSCSVKTIQFFVYSLSTQRPSLSTSSKISYFQSSTHVTPSLAVTALTSSFNKPTGFTSQTSYTGSTKVPSSTSETSSISPVIPFLKDAKLRHVPSGLVGHSIAFSVSDVDKPHLFRFLWSWKDQSPLEEAGPSLTYNFTAPGQYFISVNISSGINYVVLYSHVTVQYPITGLQIREVAVGSSNVLFAEFEILQGNNVTYSVKYGDNSGKSECGRHLFQIQTDNSKGDTTNKR